jgi:hypothetical protein
MVSLAATFTYQHDRPVIRFIALLASQVAINDGGGFSSFVALEGGRWISVIQHV